MSGGQSMHTSDFDLIKNVQVRVGRSVQNPFYSVFREETTRDSCQAMEATLAPTSKAKELVKKYNHNHNNNNNNSIYDEDSSSSKAKNKLLEALSAPGFVQSSKNNLLYFPFQNAKTSDITLIRESKTVPQTVALVLGDSEFQGKFLAEQYLNRGISVLAFTDNLERARELYVPIASGEREQRQRASHGFVSLNRKEERTLLNVDGNTDTTNTTSSGKAEDDATVAAGKHSTKKDNMGTIPENLRVERFVYDFKNNASALSKEVTLELVEGDVRQFDHVEYALRHATLVYYLASASQPHGGKGMYLTDSEEERHGAFLRAVDASRRADAHFVAITPLWVRWSWLSPRYWYRRLWSHPRGYCFSVVHQENTLIHQHGSLSPRCYCAFEEVDQVSMWQYWWLIWRSEVLPEDVERLGRSPLRFSLFRTGDVVYPCLNERLTAAKNNSIKDKLKFNHINSGTLDARLLTGTLAKSVSLCRSVVGSRIDLSGDLRRGIDMKDTNAVFDLFESFRCE